MPLIEIQSRVGPDGVLTLAVPVGADNANRDVTITISTLDRQPTAPSMTQAEWEAFVLKTAGSIDDPTFERPPQGKFEDRGEMFP